MMENIVEKLNQSELFPENIKKFLIDAVRSEKMNNDSISELEQMLKEEEEEIFRINSKKVS